MAFRLESARQYCSWGRPSREAYPTFPLCARRAATGQGPLASSRYTSLEDRCAAASQQS